MGKNLCEVIHFLSTYLITLYALLHSEQGGGEMRENRVNYVGVAITGT